MHVDQDGRLNRIPIVVITGSKLEVPDELAGSGIKRDDAVGVEVVARPICRVEIGRRITRTPVDKVQLRIEQLTYAVLAAELFNSAIETMFRGLVEATKDRIWPSLDIAAGAVLLASVIAAVVGAVVFLQRFAEILWPE